MVRAGLFDDLDVCMDWHPGDEIEASTQSSKALVDFRLKFYGDAATRQEILGMGTVQLMRWNYIQLD